MIKNRRIKTPTDVRQVVGEQLNKLRVEEVSKEDIDKARAIGYLSTVALTAMRDGELEERIKQIENQLKG